MAAAVVVSNVGLVVDGVARGRKDGGVVQRIVASGSPSAMALSGGLSLNSRGAGLRFQAQSMRKKRHEVGERGRLVRVDAMEEAGFETIAAAVMEKGPSTADLKRILVESLNGTDRGLSASSETRGEIVELITQLEAANPTPAPTDALTLLNGKWILAYTSFSELFPLLAAGNLPLVKVGEVSQTIDALAFTVQNSVTFTGPLATTSFSASATFEVRSPKRVQIKFEEGVIGTPQLTDSIDIPESVDVLGRRIELASFQSALRPLQDAASSVARTISGQPPFKFSIQADKAQAWLLTTYLDEDLRISRGDGGSIFVLLKESSPLLDL